MQFALLGDHPDGVGVTKALVESGRHNLRIYCGTGAAKEYLHRWNITATEVHDLETVLAEPEINAVIVAGNAGDRPNQLRRALQSDKHVLCVHPVDQDPNIAFEAFIVQKDTSRVLLPLLPETLHPAFEILAELIAIDRDRNESAGTDEPLRLPRLIEMERHSTEPILLDIDLPGRRPAFPGWDVLRYLGGEIVEVLGFALTEEPALDEPLLLAGRFAKGGVFQSRLMPLEDQSFWRIIIHLAHDCAQLNFPDGWPGPARLTWRDEKGTLQDRHWEAWNPWPPMVAAFEAAVVRARRNKQESDKAASLPQTTNFLGWDDEIRALELDEAAARSIERRRSSTLEYPEDVEEASFKGAMTLVGCGILLGSVLLLGLSMFVPWLGWFIFPLFAIFLVAQLLRTVIPARAGATSETKIKAVTTQKQSDKPLSH